MKRTDLLVELEAAALAYASADADYRKLFKGMPMKPEVEAACRATVAPQHRLEMAARHLHGFDVSRAQESEKAGALVAFALANDGVAVQSIRAGAASGTYQIDASNGLWAAYMRSDGWQFNRVSDATEPTATTLAAEARASAETVTCCLDAVSFPFDRPGVEIDHTAPHERLDSCVDPRPAAEARAAIEHKPVPKPGLRCGACLLEHVEIVAVEDCKRGHNNEAR